MKYRSWFFACFNDVIEVIDGGVSSQTKMLPNDGG